MVLKCTLHCSLGRADSATNVYREFLSPIRSEQLSDQSTPLLAYNSLFHAIVQYAWHAHCATRCVSSKVRSPQKVTLDIGYSMIDDLVLHCTAVWIQNCFQVRKVGWPMNHVMGHDSWQLKCLADQPMIHGPWIMVHDPFLTVLQLLRLLTSFLFGGKTRPATCINNAEDIVATPMADPSVQYSQFSTVNFTLCHCHAT